MNEILRRDAEQIIQASLRAVQPGSRHCHPRFGRP